ncbi:MAG: diguanylate cyclase [Vicinamibacteria bacterium]|nr:diguanylate cyclase [Vicinamibacteria bacterium]
MSLALTGPITGSGLVAGRPVLLATFADLPIGARVFFAVVVAAGAGALVLQTSAGYSHWPVLLGLLAGASAAALFRVDLPFSLQGTTMSLSFAFAFAALLLLGPHPTLLVASVAAWVQCTVNVSPRNPLHRTAFSVAAVAVTATSAGVVFLNLGGEAAFSAPGLIGQEKAILGAALTYFVLNTFITAVAVSLTSGHPLARVWNEHAVWSALSYIVGGAVAATAAVLLSGEGAWLTPLLVGPLYLTHRTYRVYSDRVEDERRRAGEMSDVHLATIEALALAIDAKDQTATSRIRRVQVHAAGLARVVGLSPSDVQGVRTAALLHDIGKLAVPEHILSKPGPLTNEEFQRMKSHPQVGAEIIATVEFPYPVAPVIHGHHERWDGKGYPAGLIGDEIPLGARILAVVDHFDALTSERPSHRALSTEDALAALLAEAGQAFDPYLVHLFVEHLPSLDDEARQQSEPARRLSFAALSGSPAAASPADPAPKRVFQDIALAHREIYALYEIAQSMGTSLGVGDTMALISSKLSSLVPFSTCALFLHEENGDLLRCRFATGVDAEILQPLAVKNGQGLVGWVGRNLRPLVNARPSADLEAGGSSGETRLQSALVCPLVANDRLIGALAVYDTEPGRFTDDHRRLLDRVAEQAASVVNNSILFEQTKQDSLTDPLTGLPNTRFMFVHLTRELARADRLKTEVSLLVMDLDGFKEINDMHGHHVGDKALREVARVLRSGIRPYDICVRYAGDEFVVVLSGCGADEAQQKQRELQQAIADIPFEVRPGRFVQIGSSFGNAVFPRDGEAYETLLATADKRMYQDKAQRKALRLGQPPEPAEDAESAKPRSVFAKIPSQPPMNRPH